MIPWVSKVRMASLNVARETPNRRANFGSDINFSPGCISLMISPKFSCKRCEIEILSLIELCSAFQDRNELELGYIDQTQIRQTYFGNDNQSQQAELHIGIIQGASTNPESI